MYQLCLNYREIEILIRSYWEKLLAVMRMKRSSNATLFAFSAVNGAQKIHIEPTRIENSFCAWRFNRYFAISEPHEM